MMKNIMLSFFAPSLRGPATAKRETRRSNLDCFVAKNAPRNDVCHSQHTVTRNIAPRNNSLQKIITITILLLATSFLLASNTFATIAPSTKTKKTLRKKPIPKKTTPNAADEIGKLLTKIRSMEASIEQTLESQKGKKIGKATIGSMMLERPGKFRWETIKPNHQLIIVNKNISIMYDVDLEQAVKRKVNYNNPGNPAMLLSGSVASLKKTFDVKKINNDFFELTPKTKGNSYQKISLVFFNGLPSSMEITDNLEQKSTITFKNIKTNIKIPNEKFLFNPPKNVEVLEAN